MNEKAEAKDKMFFRFYYKLIDDGVLARMTGKDVKLYLTICRHANLITGIAYPAVLTLARLSGVHKDDIRTITAKLEAIGLIKVVRAGKSFSYRNTYAIASRDEIDTAVALSILPERKRLWRNLPRGKDGRFLTIPENTDTTIPKNTENDNPQNQERANSVNTDTAVVPEITEKKDNEKDNNNRNTYIRTHRKPKILDRKTFVELKERQEDEDFKAREAFRQKQAKEYFDIRRAEKEAEARERGECP